MIRIHRALPVVEIDHRLISLSEDEYRLLVVLGMMDNRIVPRQWLLETMCEGRAQIQSDNQVLTTKICRLRKNVGADRLKNVRKQGYTLQGSVRFVGQPAS